MRSSFPFHALLRASRCIALLLLIPHDLETQAEDSHTQSEPLAGALSRGWFDPPLHSDFTRRGTAFVDLQTLETPYMCHLMRVNVAGFRTKEGRELELSAEVEWALTRRILFAAELPYVWLDPQKRTERRRIRRLCGWRPVSASRIRSLRFRAQC